MNQKNNNTKWNIEQIVEAMGGKRSGNGWIARCPSHDDKNPSLSVTEKDGQLLVHCFAGCAQDGVLNELKSRGLWPDSQEKALSLTKETQYVYNNIEGSPVLRIVRKDHPTKLKQFYQQHLENGEWVKGGYKGEVLPYQWEKASKSETIFVTEGEKCCHHVMNLGFPATAFAGGANGWRPHYAKHFCGRKVIFLPDNDLPGREFTLAAYVDIKSVAAKCAIIELPGLMEGGDIVDWCHNGHSKEDLKDLISGATSPESVVEKWRDEGHEAHQNKVSLMSHIPASDVQKRPIRLKAQSLALFEAREAQWLWKNRICFGTVSLVEGDGGLGKSFILADLISRLSLGYALPGDTPKNPMKCLLVSAEDDKHVVLRPRFESQGANLENVLIEDQHFSLNENGIQELERLIAENKIQFAVIDPIQAFVGRRMDLNKANDIRSMIAPLHQIASKHSCAIVIVRHWNKATQASASHRGAGSVDFRNGARSVLQILKSEDQRFLCHDKSNYGQLAPTLTFEIKNGRLTWTGESHLTADEILGLNAAISREDQTEIDEAVDFIESELKHGVIESRQLLNRARDLGISPATLKRARTKAGVKAFKMVGSNQYWVSLSEDEDQMSGCGSSILAEPNDLHATPIVANGHTEKFEGVI